MHERDCDPTDKYAFWLLACGPYGKIDCRGSTLPLEGEKSRHVDPIPSSIQNLFVLALNERNMVSPTEVTMISRKFHQSERRILVWVARLDKQNFPR